MSKRWQTWMGYGVLLLLGSVLLDVVIAQAVADGISLSPQASNLGGDDTGFLFVASALTALVRAAGLFVIVVAAVLLALETAGLNDPGGRRKPGGRRRFGTRRLDAPVPLPEDRELAERVLAAVGPQPRPIGEIADETGLFQVTVRRVLSGLESRGRVVAGGGGYRRVTERVE